MIYFEDNKSCSLYYVQNCVCARKKQALVLNNMMFIGDIMLNIICRMVSYW